MIFWSDACIFLLKTKNQSSCKTTEVPNANNWTKIEYKTRRDHDITMANAMNTKLPAKIKGWCGTGDSLTYHINSLSWNSGCKRNESSLSYGWYLRQRRIGNRKEVRFDHRYEDRWYLNTNAPPLSTPGGSRGAIRRVVSIEKICHNKLLRIK